MEQTKILYKRFLDVVGAIATRRDCGPFFLVRETRRRVLVQRRAHNDTTDIPRQLSLRTMRINSTPYCSVSKVRFRSFVPRAESD